MERKERTAEKRKERNFTRMERREAREKRSRRKSGCGEGDQGKAVGERDLPEYITKGGTEKKEAVWPQSGLFGEGEKGAKKGKSGLQGGKLNQGPAQYVQGILV